MRDSILVMMIGMAPLPIAAHLAVFILGNGADGFSAQGAHQYRDAVTGISRSLPSGSESVALSIAVAAIMVALFVATSFNRYGVVEGSSEAARRRMLDLIVDKGSRLLAIAYVVWASFMLPGDAGRQVAAVVLILMGGLLLCLSGMSQVPPEYWLEAQTKEAEKLKRLEAKFTQLRLLCDERRSPLDDHRRARWGWLTGIYALSCAVAACLLLVSLPEMDAVEVASREPLRFGAALVVVWIVLLLLCALSMPTLWIVAELPSSWVRSRSDVVVKLILFSLGNVVWIAMAFLAALQNGWGAGLIALPAVLPWIIPLAFRRSSWWAAWRLDRCVANLAAARASVSRFRLYSTILDGSASLPVGTTWERSPQETSRGRRSMSWRIAAAVLLLGARAWLVKMRQE
ncbi:hypothetical protein [Mobilicoccus massiliensis]|uniref:hypothetical protein n=1 Tax=Mobilicoccus massiliensis TaxID=1522310 RepID=UPI0011443595|nr:hypothetical protein [Mobilicoccus massiliensis]